jgi:hypothetical protein
MKRFLLWSFERGSPQYDVICAIILSFIFLTPESAFNDRPPWMRPPRDEVVRESTDDYGQTVYTVRIETPLFASDETQLKAAMEELRKFIAGAFTVLKTQPIYDTAGMPRAYAIWIER